MNKYCLLSFDIEEWFQVENFRQIVSNKDWKNKRSSVKENTNKILDILEKYDLRATFFILGWIAERFPELITTIISKGHEIASHGYNHDLVNTMSKEKIYDDVNKSKQILETILRKKVIGYRAPSFSVNDNLIEILTDLGFKYDASYNPFQLNRRYGKMKVPANKIYNIYKINNTLYEIPASTLRFLSNEIPISGGAYFRLLPFQIFKRLVKRKINTEGFYNFYLHPWELEPDQPRIKNIPLNYRLRHYTGLSKTAEKLEKLIVFLKERECKFVTMRDYIDILER